MALEHKGYSAGPIEIDEDQGLLTGMVAGIRDGVSFAGRTADELQTAFRESVDDYLAFCAEDGVSPERPDAPGMSAAARGRTTDPLFYELGEAWREIQSVLFSSDLAAADRQTIEKGLRRLEKIRAALEQRAAPRPTGGAAARAAAAQEKSR